MAKTENSTRFHNISSETLADMIGTQDAVAKAAIAELDALKAEFKARGIEAAQGARFAVTATESIQGRLDSAAVKAFLGEAYHRFEKAIISTTIRIKASPALALAA